MKRTYDNVAFFYDRLARLVYGRTLIKAQVYLLKAIPINSRLLIVGGGTGWILNEIASIHPSGLSITYIDISEKMIALAKKKDAGSNKVAFINAPIQDFKPDSVFDVVITPFLLDNFTNDTLSGVFSLLDDLLVSNGLWLYCDFQNTVVSWQRAVLKIMYLFFRLVCGVETAQLPNVDLYFSNKEYKILSEKTFVKEFITSKVYRKQ